MITENGSGGSRIGVLTTFEDGDDGHYTENLAEVGRKVDGLYASLGRTAIIDKSSSDTKHEWLRQSVFPVQLDRPSLSGFMSPHLPNFEIPDISARRI